MASETKHSRIEFSADGGSGGTVVHPLTANPIRCEVSESRPGERAYLDVYDAVNGRHLGTATLYRDGSMSRETFNRLSALLREARP